MYSGPRKNFSGAIRRLAPDGRRYFLRLILCSVLLIALFPTQSHAQFKGDDIPGLLALANGTQAPPGLYLGNLVWAYPTDTIKDNNGNNIKGPGSLTSTAEIIPINVVTP